LRDELFLEEKVILAEKNAKTFFENTLFGRSLVGHADRRTENRYSNFLSNFVLFSNQVKFKIL